MLSAVARLAAPPSGGSARYAVAGGLAVLALAGAAVWWLMAPPDSDGRAAPAREPGAAAEPELPNPVQLRFSCKPPAEVKVSLDDTLRVNLQTNRRIVDGERLAQQPGGYYYTAYPGQGERILKRDFDRLGPGFQDRPLPVAVIRPPLTLSADKLSFGIAAGVVQPSGQVRFTFSAQHADAIAEAMLAARSGSAAARRVIKRDKYVYKVAGTRERRETPTLAGICSHVKAP